MPTTPRRVPSLDALSNRVEALERSEILYKMTVVALEKADSSTATAVERLANTPSAKPSSAPSSQHWRPRMKQPSSAAVVGYAVLGIICQCLKLALALFMLGYTGYVIWRTWPLAAWWLN